jgi:hypothetical protein
VNGSSGILQFLARASRSVDPLPATVKDLTRTVLDHLYGGDPDDPVRYGPLAWLQACCRNFPHLVSEVIAGRVQSMLASHDEQAQAAGLSLAAWLGEFDTGNDSLRSLVGRPQVKFRRDFSAFRTGCCHCCGRAPAESTPFIGTPISSAASAASAIIAVPSTRLAA